MRSMEELAFSEIHNIVRRDVDVFEPDDSVSQVLGSMMKNDRYEVLVESNGKIGLVSVRDLLEVAQPAQTTIQGLWAVSRSVTSCERVIKVISEMMKNNIRALPVVEKGEIVGIISQVELIEALHDIQELSDVRAKELMKKPVVTLEANDSVASARRYILDHGFSHIPVVDQNRIAGIITAKGLTHIFIAPIDSVTTGDRIGEKTPRFTGSLRDIMDVHPYIVRPETTTLEIVNRFKELRVSSCIVTDEEGHILGIITPREVLSLLLKFKVVEEALPVYIVGLSADEDWFDVEVARDKVRRVVERALDIHPHISEVSITVKHSREEGNRTRYEVNAHVYTQATSMRFFVEKRGWDLLKVFDEICDALNKILRAAKHEP